MKVVLAAFLLLLCVSTKAWTVQESVDAMTDKVVRQVFVTSSDGTTLTLIRRNNGSVWGYLKLSGLKQFMVGERLMLRVDRDPPIEFNEDLQKMTAKLGMPVISWEWNPSLIGFLMWHGKPEQGCGIVKRLMESSKVLVRYHPNQSLTRDILFDTLSNRALIGKALDLDVTQCVEQR